MKKGENRCSTDSKTRMPAARDGGDCSRKNTPEELSTAGLEASAEKALMLSVAPPRAKAITGRPKDRASTGTMPKSSSAGKTSARQCAYCLCNSSSESAPQK